MNNLLGLLLSLTIIYSTHLSANVLKDDVGIDYKKIKGSEGQYLETIKEVRYLPVSVFNKKDERIVVKTTKNSTIALLNENPGEVEHPRSTVLVEVFKMKNLVEGSKKPIVSWKEYTGDISILENDLLLSTVYSFVIDCGTVNTLFNVYTGKQLITYDADLNGKTITRINVPNSSVKRYIGISSDARCQGDIIKSKINEDTVAVLSYSSNTEIIQQIQIGHKKYAYDFCWPELKVENKNKNSKNEISNYSADLWDSSEEENAKKAVNGLFLNINVETHQGTIWAKIPIENDRLVIEKAVTSKGVTLKE